MSTSEGQWEPTAPEFIPYNGKNKNFRHSHLKVPFQKISSTKVKCKLNTDEFSWPKTELMSLFNQNANGIEVKLSMVVLQRKRGAGNGQYYWTHLTSIHDTLTKTYSYNHSLSDKYVLIYYTSKELFIDFYPIYHHCCRQKKGSNHMNKII